MAHGIDGLIMDDLRGWSWRERMEIRFAWWRDSHGFQLSIAVGLILASLPLIAGGATVVWLSCGRGLSGHTGSYWPTSKDRGQRPGLVASSHYLEAARQRFARVAVVVLDGGGRP